MERARFFYLLHLARIFKAKRFDRMERWVRLFWMREAYTYGWWASEALRFGKEG